MDGGSMTSPTSGPAHHVGERACVHLPLVTGLALIALLLGLGTYASDPLGFSDPLLALYAIGSLTALAALCWALPALRRRPRLAGSMVVLGLFVYAELMTIATGLTGGPFIGLYALALWAAALTWRPWPVAGLACLIFGIAALQSSVLDSMNDMHVVTSLMVLLDGLGPPLVATGIITWLRPRLGPHAQYGWRTEPARAEHAGKRARV
jgi:hypothetical protein